MIYFGSDGIAREKKQAVGVLLPPMARLSSGEIMYAYDCAEKKPDTAFYEYGFFCARDTVSALGNGLYAIRREITNTSEETVSFKDILRVKDLFPASRYLIPCILYNGNEHGSSHTPKGLLCNGKPWIFAYDRMGIPSCTLTENRENALALFASNDTPASLISSCSLVPSDGGTYEHRIFRPVTEAPYTYSSKNIMTDRYDGYLTLAPGKTFVSTTYLFLCRPRMENYAAADLIDRALDVLSPELDPCLPPEKVFSLGISYAKALLYDYQGQKMIVTHYAPRLFRYQHMVKITPDEMAEMMKDPYYTEIGAFDERFEMGWADQGLLNARMLAVDAIRRGDAEQLGTAVGIFDAFCATQRENGLCYTLYEQNFAEGAEKTATPDACNLGWGGAEMVRMYELLKKNGVEKPEYLTFARRVCDFFIRHYSTDCGFGKSYTIAGEPKETTGSVGGFMIVALLEFYRVSGEGKYLAYAIKAHDFYYRRDLDRFVCTAGALDCCSIDKETAYPFLVSSLQLYAITEDPMYIERAEKAAYYFTSWMFFYDVLYPNGSEFTEYGYHTTGGTAISAEHHAIDSWGSAVVPSLYVLSKLTGKRQWQTVARLMWANAIQGITEREGQLFHGQQRPIGAQNEGFFQARWTKYRPTCEERGHFNDCLSAWCGAYRMMTVLQMEEADKKALDLLR